MAASLLPPYTSIAKEFLISSRGVRLLLSRHDHLARNPSHTHAHTHERTNEPRQEGLGLASRREREKRRKKINSSQMDQIHDGPRVTKKEREHNCDDVQHSRQHSNYTDERNPPPPSFRQIHHMLYTTRHALRTTHYDTTHYALVNEHRWTAPRRASTRSAGRWSTRMRRHYLTASRI